MTPLIEKLIDQAYRDEPHEREWDSTVRVFHKETFAKMVAKECLKSINESQGDLDFAVWKISKDFGVE